MSAALQTRRAAAIHRIFGVAATAAADMLCINSLGTVCTIACLHFVLCTNKRFSVGHETTLDFLSKKSSNNRAENEKKSA